jgi:hypothetical protein
LHVQPEVQFVDYGRSVQATNAQQVGSVKENACRLGAALIRIVKWR